MSEDVRGRTLADIEFVVQWAIERSSGALPWRGVHPRELMADGGYTVVPKNCSRRYNGNAAVLPRGLGRDGNQIIDAIKQLDGAAAAIVVACGRAKIRPSWGAEPRRVAIFKWHKKKHRKVVKGFMTVAPSAEAICAARGAYQRWHAALATLAAALKGELEAWEISGFAAPAQPWNQDAKKAA